MPGVSRLLPGNRRVNLKELALVRQTGGPLCNKPARRAATGKARVNVIRCLMLVLRRGCAVFLFGYLYEPYSGASGAANSSKRGGLIEVLSEHRGPELRSGVNQLRLLILRALP